MDRRHLNLARETDVRYELLIPGEAEAMLLVEQHADTATSCDAKLDEVVELAQYKTGLAAAAHVAEDEADFQLYWGLAQRFVPTLHRLQGSTRPRRASKTSPCPSSCAARFPAARAGHAQAAAGHRLVFGHAAHGQLHIRPFLDLANPDDVRDDGVAGRRAVRKSLAAAAARSAASTATASAARRSSPGSTARWSNVFREVKQIFDPQGLLNPGKIVPLAPTRMTQNLRPTGDRICRQPSRRSRSGADRQTASRSDRSSCSCSWQPDEMAAAARAVQRLRRLPLDVARRADVPDLSHDPREEASPRAKANLDPRAC